MVSIGEKVKIKKAGNLNQGRSYVTTTVIKGLCLNMTANITRKVKAFHFCKKNPADDTFENYFQSPETKIEFEIFRSTFLLLLS